MKVALIYVNYARFEYVIYTLKLGFSKLVRKANRATVVHMEALREYVGVLVEHWPVLLSYCPVMFELLLLTFAKHSCLAPASTYLGD